MKASDLLKNTGRSIAYRPKLAKLFGGATAEIFFEQIFYWQDKAENQKLGVYKTQAELEEETGLSRKEQETARKILREKGLLIETNKRLEHKLYYKIDTDKLDEILSDIGGCPKGTTANETNEHSRMPESDIGGSPKGTTVIYTLDYNTRLHTNNHLNPPTAEKAASENLRNQIADLLEGKFDLDNAKALHDAVEQYLTKNGFECFREYSVEDRGDGRRGRVDLVVKKDNLIVGIELDSTSARDKSVFKLNQLPAGLVVLRHGEIRQRDTIDNILVISANSKTKSEKIDYQAIVDLFNRANEETGSRLPRVDVVNDMRKRGIKKFLKELKKPTLECVENYFISFFDALRPFHLGKNDHDWIANFNYAIRPKVVLDVREGTL